MSFVFASSHLPEVKRPADEDEEEEDVQPMQRSGMVRAFSHLPPPVRAAPRAAAPPGRPAWAAAPDSPSGHDPEPDDDADEGHGPSASSGPHEPDDGRPWYQPRITAADLQPEGGEHDAPAKDNVGPVPRLSGGAGSFRPLPEHVEDDAADTGRADAGSHVDFEPPATASSDSHGTIGPVTPRGAPPPAGRSLFLTPRPMPPEYARQQTKTYGSAPDTTDEAPASRSAPFPQSRHFEKRSTPEAFFTQQGLRASGPSSQQRPQESQQAIAAQQQVRASNPPAPGGRLAVQPQALAQAPAQGGAPVQQNQGTDATKQGAGTNPAKAAQDPLTILSEKFAAFPDAAKALKQLYTLPTGRLMIDKLATLADKIKIGLTPGNESYMDNGVFRVRQNIDEATLAHEFQHLGEMLFRDKNPFLKVEHPEDVKKYPDLTHYDYEFRAMRMQNQIRLERARMNKTRPLLHPVYYDKTGAYPIPGSLLPQP